MLYKIYTNNNVYKSVIEGGIIGSDFSYSIQQNGGQGVMRITLNRDYSDESVIYGDIIKVFDDYGILKYTGFVNSIYRRYTPKYSYIEYECVGISSILSQVIYQDGGDFQKVITTTPTTLINDVLSIVNSKHSIISTSGNIQISGSSIDIEIKGNTCKEILDIVSSITGWKWYLNCNGELTFGDSTYYNSHRLKLGKQIENMEIIDDGNQISNVVILRTTEITYNAGGNEIRTPIYTEYTDGPSIGLYKRREILSQQDNIIDTTTGSIVATNILAENSTPKQKMILDCIINDSVVDSIIPGDLISIRNSDYLLEDIEVSKVTYSQKRVTIEIKMLENYTKALQNKTL